MSEKSEESTNLPIESHFAGVEEFCGPPIQINGHRVLGPPKFWTGPPPPNTCELHIRNIPKKFYEGDLVPHFQRFGKIYEFRLMMDFNKYNRGFGYVKYTNEVDATRAREVMQHFFVEPGKTLDIVVSYDKCRLFVGNIPRNLTKADIEQEFRSCFPNITSILMHNRISEGHENRGFVFLNFRTHQDALHVKKLTTPGRLRKWGRDLKIVWAYPERGNADPESLKSLTTLFVRNIDLTVNKCELFILLTTIVGRSDILKLSRTREFAFIDFSSHFIAEKVLNELQDVELKGHSLYFEWAKPPSENSVHSLRNNDFDAVLRLKCIANYWTVPVIMFGRIFPQNAIQYVAVAIANATKFYVYFFEISILNLTDVQSRVCEAVIALIHMYGQLPPFNYVVKITKNTAHVVGIITDLFKAQFIKASNIEIDMFLCSEEIASLSKAMGQLLLLSQVQVLNMYESCLAMNLTYNYLNGFICNDRILGCVSPNYRQKPPIKYDLNGSQIVFALCHRATLSNVTFPSVQAIFYNFRDTEENAKTGVKYTQFSLFPSYRKPQTRDTMGGVFFGDMSQQFYGVYYY